jgi:hypothetical protein
MYAVLTSMNLGPNMRSVGEQTANQAFRFSKYMRGFKGATFFCDVETGEYLRLLLWESKEDLEAADSFIGPKLREIAGNFLKAGPTSKIFEVYEPRLMAFEASR